MTDIFFGGGINQRDDLNISPEECFSGQNFLLDAKARSFRPRLPCDLLGTATGGGLISSIMQLIKRDDTETSLVVSGPNVYKWNGATTFSSMTTVVTDSQLRATYWSLDDNLVITDIGLNNVIQSWDGTTFQKHKHGVGTGTTKTATITRSGSTASAVVTSHGYSNNDLVTIAGADQSAYNGEFIISNVSTDGFDYTVSGTPASPATGTITAEQSVDLYAKYSAVFNNRVWLFNIKDVNGATTSLNPHMILASGFEDADTLDIATTTTSSGLTGNEPFFILAPDMRPVNGVVQFFNLLLISTTDGKLFKLTGSDSTDYSFQEYYAGSSATGTETMEGTGNDIVYMKKDGNIDFIGSVDTYGDISADDASRWIRTEVSGLTDAITVYDQERQRVYFFVTNEVLVLDKTMFNERPELSPWSIFKTGMSNNFNTSAATYMRKPGSTGYDVYWGDSTGRLFKMNGTSGSGDAGDTTVVSKRKSGFVESQTEHRNITGKVEYRRRGICTLKMEFDWAGEYASSFCNLSLKDPIVGDAYFGGQYYFGGEVYFNADTSGLLSDKISYLGFSPVGKAPGFFLELTVDTKADWLINRISY